MACIFQALEKSCKSENKIEKWPDCPFKESDIPNGQHLEVWTYIYLRQKAEEGEIKTYHKHPDIFELTIIQRKNRVKIL